MSANSTTWARGETQSSIARPCPRKKEFSPAGSSSPAGRGGGRKARGDQPAHTAKQWDRPRPPRFAPPPLPPPERARWNVSPEAARAPRLSVRPGSSFRPCLKCVERESISRSLRAGSERKAGREPRSAAGEEGGHAAGQVHRLMHAAECPCETRARAACGTATRAAIGRRAESVTPISIRPAIE